MSEGGADLQARREAVQPSLWDRLVDDLPGLVAETDALRAGLDATLGAEAVAALLHGGPRAIEADAALTRDARRQLHRLAAQVVQRQRLEASGIVVTPAVLREAVRRDIEALFNIERLEARFLLTERETARLLSPEDALADFPQIRRSVLNYGVPSFAGRTGTDFDKTELARDLREVLAAFEPRLKRESIKVAIRFGEKTGMRIDIDAVLMLSPVPERLLLSTTVDLDNGRAVTTLEET